MFNGAPRRHSLRRFSASAGARPAASERVRAQSSDGTAALPLKARVALFHFPAAGRLLW